MKIARPSEMVAFARFALQKLNRQIILEDIYCVSHIPVAINFNHRLGRQPGKQLPCHNFTVAQINFNSLHLGPFLWMTRNKNDLAKFGCPVKKNPVVSPALGNLKSGHLNRVHFPIPGFLVFQA